MSNGRYRIPEARDWRGNLIKEGSTVLYPRASGRSVEIREATVLEVWRREEDRYHFEWDTDADGKRHGVRRELPAYVFKLEPTGRTSRFEFWGDEKAHVWIQNGENVTLV